MVRITTGKGSGRVVFSSFRQGGGVFFSPSFARAARVPRGAPRAFFPPHHTTPHRSLRPHHLAQRARAPRCYYFFRPAFDDPCVWGMCLWQRRRRCEAPSEALVRRRGERVRGRSDNKTRPPAPTASALHQFRQDPILHAIFRWNHVLYTSTRACQSTLPPNTCLPSTFGAREKNKKKHVRSNHARKAGAEGRRGRWGEWSDP